MIKTKYTPDSLKAPFPFWDGNGSENLAAALLSDDMSLDELVKADNFCRVPAVAPATMLQVKQIVTGEIIIINYGILNYYISLKDSVMIIIHISVANFWLLQTNKKAKDLINSTSY